MIVLLYAEEFEESEETREFVESWVKPEPSDFFDEVTPSTEREMQLDEDGKPIQPKTAGLTSHGNNN